MKYCSDSAVKKVISRLRPAFRVPNAKEGNDSIELDIYGMAGVDEALVALGRAPEEPGAPSVCSYAASRCRVSYSIHK
jgi:hypothetical protein